MADITNAAQIGINQHNYDINTKKKQADNNNKNNETQNGEETGKILSSLDAMSAYNQGKITKTKAKEVNKTDDKYKFDPEKVSEDVKNFQESFDIVKDVSSEYMQALIDAGYEKDIAEDKAAQFAACLLVH